MNTGVLPASVCLPTSFPPRHRSCYLWIEITAELCLYACTWTFSHPTHCLHPLSSRQSAVILLRRTRQKLRQEQADMEEW